MHKKINFYQNKLYHMTTNIQNIKKFHYFVIKEEMLRIISSCTLTKSMDQSKKSKKKEGLS